MKIISFYGFKGCGKDTAAFMANEFLADYSIPSTRLAFADALREEVLAAFPGITMEDLQHRTIKETPHGSLTVDSCLNEGFRKVMINLNSGAGIQGVASPRQIMQWWGTEYRRAQNPNYWLDRFTERAVQANVTGDAFLFVTDMRFINEAVWLNTMGARLVRVVRDAVVPELLLGLHPSETEQLLISADVDMPNNGTMDDLRESVSVITGLELAS